MTPKDRILLRRAKLVTAALASVAAAAECGGVAQPCLKIAPDSGPADSGADASDAGDASRRDADAEPQPCLTPLPDQ